MNTKTGGSEWRDQLKAGDEIDFYDISGKWQTCTVISRDDGLDSMEPPKIKVGFRRYKPDGINEDAMGKYFGKKKMFDVEAQPYSILV